MALGRSVWPAGSRTRTRPSYCDHASPVTPAFRISPLFSGLQGAESDNQIRRWGRGVPRSRIDPRHLAVARLQLQTTENADGVAMAATGLISVCGRPNFPDS